MTIRRTRAAEVALSSALATMPRMDTWFILLEKVAIVVGVVLVGFVARRMRVLTEAADRSLLRLIIDVLVPCLILDMIVGNPALLEADNVILPPLVGIGTLLLGFGAAALLARTCPGPTRIDTPPKRRSFVFGTGLYNYGYLPLPLAYALFSDETVGVLFVHNLGIEVGIWTIGVIILTGGLEAGWWKRVVNPPVVAIVVALLLNLAPPSLTESSPSNVLGQATTLTLSAIGGLIEMLAVCAIPIALLLIGATIADHWKEANLLRNWRLVTAAAALRCVVLPAAFLAIAWSFRDVFSEQLVQVMVIEAAMPAATLPIVLSKVYKGDAPTAVQITVGTSLVGLVTMPFWISLGIEWLNLTVHTNGMAAP